MFVVIESSKKEKFLEHINKMDPHIHFTAEDARADGSIPFLNTLVMPQPENSLITSVYRKPTHKNLYLQWDSHYHLAAKVSVINTLKYRAKTVCSNNQLPKEQEGHLRQALKRCKYPVWALNRDNIKQKKPTVPTKIPATSGIAQLSETTSNTSGKGNSESYKKICRKYGIEMHFRGGSTIKDLLVHPRDRETILQKSGVIYRYKCGRVDYAEEYLGESGRTFKKGSENT